ncbi:MAG: bifunctional pyr operon transcriptional regulator/uracil phosphoribosyltransferase PyrR [Planctomycetota bacterium]|nr:MAG: bifunctional pyr operon transcriptional regulator/uracil phosphoribosyltransferase PyrR [Planctomycetota bacterium]
MKTILTANQLTETLDKMAAEIASCAPGDAPVAIVGIRRRGEVLARRMQPMLQKHGLRPKHQGALDITLYRDDLTTIGPHAVVRGTEIDFDITDTWLVLVDDVLYTGRSVRAALDALTDLGRPRAIRLAVLVDRGHRELPIQPDFVGVHVQTSTDQIVKVQLQEVDDAEGVAIA